MTYPVCYSLLSSALGGIFWKEIKNPKPFRICSIFSIKRHTDTIIPNLISNYQRDLANYNKSKILCVSASPFQLTEMLYLLLKRHESDIKEKYYVFNNNQNWKKF